MLNRLQIIGNVGHTPEIKPVNGVKVANIQVGITEKGYTTKDGQKVEDRTDWFTIVAWRGLAEVIQKYVNKGDKLYIDGRMKSRQYEKDGQKRTVWELYAENIELLTPKKTDRQCNPLQAITYKKMKIPHSDVAYDTQTSGQINQVSERFVRNNLQV